MKAKSAFTLIELLTVVAIIGVLSGIVIKAVSSARASARNARDVGNLRALGLATLLFANEHNGNIPLYETRDSAGQLKQAQGVAGGAASPVRALFPAGTLPGIPGQKHFMGNGDYLGSTTVLYSAHISPSYLAKNPLREGFLLRDTEIDASGDPFLGYNLYSSPSSDPFVVNQGSLRLPNDNVTQWGRAPLYSSIYSDRVRKALGITSDRMTVLHLNGSVSVRSRSAAPAELTPRLYYLATGGTY